MANSFSLPLCVAVPELASYKTQPGIARSFRSLDRCWGVRVQLVEADFKKVNLPVARNFPWAVRPSKAADLILLPKMMGTLGLRNSKKLPGMVVMHDLGIIDVPDESNSSGSFSRHLILQNLHALKFASHIIAVSNFTRDRLLNYMPSLTGRVSTVLNGIQPIFHSYKPGKTAARQQVEQILGHALRGPLLLYVGSEIPRKNMPLLLRMFKQFKQIEPAAQLLKVGGPGPAHNRSHTLKLLEELRLQPGDDVILFDHINDQLLADLYACADVFVSASLYEGFGLPFAEAMAMGTPVVVADCGAARETVGDTGWVVAPEVEPFVAAIQSALDAPQTRLQAGRRQAAIFTWERAADEYLAIMEQLVA